MEALTALPPLALQRFVMPPITGIAVPKLLALASERIGALLPELRSVIALLPFARRTRAIQRKPGIVPRNLLALLRAETGARHLLAALRIAPQPLALAPRAIRPITGIAAPKLLALAPGRNGALPRAPRERIARVLRARALGERPMSIAATGFAEPARALQVAPEIAARRKPAAPRAAGCALTRTRAVPAL